MVCVALTVVARAAVAGEELSTDEIRALSSGQLVVREDQTEHNGRRYVGGVSYVVIGARPREVSHLLDDARVYRDILPRTRSVRWLGIARTGESILELEQGTSLVHGRYVARVRRDRGGDDDSAIFRFWLDPSFRHDIADASGFFRVEPFGDKTLLTYLVLIDLGDGLFVRLFEHRVQRAALSTPALVKTYVESHRPPS
jgi:hypothetical protein